MSTQYQTGETTQEYWAQIQNDVLATPGYQQAGNLSSSGVLTGQSTAGNNYAAQMRYLAQGQIVAGVPQVPASGVSVPGMTVGGYPNNSTTGFGTTFTNVAGSPGATQNNIAAGTPIIQAITSIAASTPSLGYVTYTSAANSFVVGQNVSISGATVAGFNVTANVVSTTATTFTIANSSTGSTSTASASSPAPNQVLGTIYNWTPERYMA